jgi:antitoxin HicB
MNDSWFLKTYLNLGDSGKMPYPFVIYPCEEGGYVAEIPALKGCLAQGETIEKVLAELKIVTKLWLETAEKYGQKLPDVAGSTTYGTLRDRKDESIE